MFSLFIAKMKKEKSEVAKKKKSTLIIQFKSFFLESVLKTIDKLTKN
jgi:hypothetical protein